MGAICNLCLQEAELLQSHIFPEFLYRLTYDEHHRTELGSLVTGAVPKTLQKGLREPLLCTACEGRFGKLERYASRVLFYNAGLKATTAGRTLTVTGVDYARFKLFLLSLLWRAGISSLPAFDQVRLGRHQEALRVRLLAAEPGARHVYPAMLSAFTKPGGLMRQTIALPYSTRLAGHRAYRVMFAGLRCTFVVSSHVRPTQAHMGVITEDGDLPIRFLSPEEEDSIVRDIAERIPATWLDDGP